jgi:hypothetical protein
MSTKSFSSILAGLLVAVLMVPAVLFVAPAHARAGGLPVVDILAHINAGLDRAIQVSSDVALVAEKVNTYVLQPLAFVLSGELLKAITAGVISFVIGEANGTGVPQFVVDIQETLRTVSTKQAQGFFRDFERNSNSPFAGSIRSALEDEFYSKTSLKGFWDRNMSTLRQSSSLYSDNYLRGDWSRGGMRAWFALTTRYENNPYTLHEAMQKQLQDQIGHEKVGAVEARLHEVAWGNGFMSWCGEFGKSYATSTNAAGVESSNPGDDCIDEDGKKGKIKTPGHAIAESLDRALGADQERIVRMGNVGPQVNEILNNIKQVAQTAQFAQTLLGGTGSGGLAGARKTTSSQPTSTLAANSASGALGVTQSSVYQANTVGGDVLARATQYETAWKSIENSAKSAATALTDLKTSCTNLVSTADTALTGPVASVLAQATIASSTVATTRATVIRLRADIAASNTSTTENFLPRVQAVDTLPPTSSDLSFVSENSTVFGDAVATPAGSLVVSGGSLIDQMNLISSNALAMKTSCMLGEGGIPPF